VDVQTSGGACSITCVKFQPYIIYALLNPLGHGGSDGGISMFWYHRVAVADLTNCPLSLVVSESKDEQIYREIASSRNRNVGINHMAYIPTNEE